MLFLNIFLIVTKIFEKFKIFNDVDVNLFEVSLAKELSTNNLIARLNRRIVSQNAIQLVAHSIN